MPYVKNLWENFQGGNSWSTIRSFDVLCGLLAPTNLWRCIRPNGTTCPAVNTSWHIVFTNNLSIWSHEAQKKRFIFSDETLADTMTFFYTPPPSNFDLSCTTGATFRIMKISTIWDMVRSLRVFEITVPYYSNGPRWKRLILWNCHASINRRDYPPKETKRKG